jgi:hypothetical protein
LFEELMEGYIGYFPPQTAPQGSGPTSYGHKYTLATDVEIAAVFLSQYPGGGLEIPAILYVEEGRSLI